MPSQGYKIEGLLINTRGLYCFFSSSTLKIKKQGFTIFDHSVEMGFVVKP